MPLIILMLCIGITQDHKKIMIVRWTMNNPLIPLMKKWIHLPLLHPISPQLLVVPPATQPGISLLLLHPISHQILVPPPTELVMYLLHHHPNLLVHRNLDLVPDPTTQEGQQMDSPQLDIKTGQGLDCSGLLMLKTLQIQELQESQVIREIFQIAYLLDWMLEFL